MWYLVSEITKICISLEIWHRFRVRFTWNQKKFKLLLGSFWQRFRVISTRNKENQIMIPGHFDTGFVWCPTPEITKIFMSLEIWHRFRVMSTRNQKIETVIEVILTQISCDVRPKSKKIEIVIGVILTQISWDVQYLKSQTSLSPWSFDTDFVWCPPGIKKRKLSLGSF